MMDIHPNWQPTEEASKEAHAQTKDHGTSVPIAVHAASRRPAAVVGVLLVLIATLAFIEGSETLQGETATNSGTPTVVQIRITDRGILPQSIQATPGQEIVWTNLDDTPHILESESLRGSDGQPLYSPAIFPGSTYRFLLASDQAPGRHSYISTTDVSVFGEIDVVGNVPPPATIPVPSTPPETPPVPATPPVTVTPVITPTTTLTAPTPAAQPSQEALIPVNPYTVESTRAHPFDPSGQPIESLFDGGGSVAATAYPRPFSQPETGPAAGLLAIATISIAGLAAVTRKCFRR
jgi:plastocyanin